MSLLNIVEFPDPRLKKIANKVAAVDDSIRTTVDNMFATMYHADGVGLAAIQVDIQQRIIVIDTSEERNQPLCLINPEIIESGGAIELNEGCLSFPGVYAKVKRNAWVKINYLDRDGNKQSTRAEGLLSVCIQHEIDHLDGITFYDHLSPLKQTLLLQKLKKARDKRNA